MKKLIALLAVLMIAGMPVAFAAVQFGGQVATYIGLSTDSKESYGTAGNTFYETDTGRMYFHNGSAWVLKYITVTSDPDTLETAAYSTPVGTAGFDEAAFNIQVSGAAGDTLTFAVEGKLGTGNDWERITRTSLSDLSSNTYDFVYSTSDSTVIVGTTGLAKLDSIRVGIVDIEDLINVIVTTRRITTLK